MKIYRVSTYVYSKGFAILRPSNTQNLRQVDVLDVWWDDWDSGGDKIGDFVFCYGVEVCRRSVFDELKNEFTEIKAVPLRYNKTKRELASKNASRLKWLPKEDVPLCAIYSPMAVSCLPQSTIAVSEGGVVKLNGVAELQGGDIIQREKDKGLYFSAAAILGYDFFSLKNTGYLILYRGG